MFASVLVANRGEIAVRIIRTLRSLGIRSVAVYSDADVSAPHVLAADAAVRIGPEAPRDSYLRIDNIVAAALSSGAEAVHPGYGFLSENPALARACQAAGLTLIGPPASAMEAMGDKIAARRAAVAAGVPVVPGFDGRGMATADLVAASLEIGLPVLLKPSAGGGGKGMRLVHEPEMLASSIEAARREAAGAFGDDALLVERYLQRPRHIEMQVAADAYGNIVHLGERECTLQRRHQKIIEESPSPFVTDAIRAALGARAVDAARACGYTNVGTVEFIMSGTRPDEFFFMEMNTRLQVEHPVTEMTYGVDLVELQLRIAAGEPLPWRQVDLVADGHAVEARVYAEDPTREFLPTGGTVHRLVWPRQRDVRVDGGIVEGQAVSSSYDPMLAKIIVHGRTRHEALRRLDHALADVSILGVVTNVALLRSLLNDDDVMAGEMDTELVERKLPQLTTGDVPDEVVVAAAVELLKVAAATDAWSAGTNWRHGGPAWRALHLRSHPGEAVDVVARSVGGGWEMTVGDGPTHVVHEYRMDRRLFLSIDDRSIRYEIYRHGNSVWLSSQGSTWQLALVDVEENQAAHHHRFDASVRSPMPGTVTAVAVSPGDAVQAGQPLVTVEAMKMEHALTATTDGVVDIVHVVVGDRVALDELLVTLAEPVAT